MKKLLVILLSVFLLVIFSGCTKKTSSDEEMIEIELKEFREPMKDSFDIPFPRLAMWWPDIYEENASSLARYDLLLNEFDDPFLWDKRKEMGNINKEQILLRPISPSEQGWYSDMLGEEWSLVIKNLPTSFFLMHQGAKLVMDIDTTNTRLKVDRLEDENENPLFYVGDNIAIGKYESATIIEIRKKYNELVVERGFTRKSDNHEAGEWIQSHVRFWPETWVMNITAACPKEKIKDIEEPIDYITYFHLLTQNKIPGLYELKEDNPYYIAWEEAAYDGLIIDRFEDHQSWLAWMDDEERKLDPYGDGTILSDEAVDDLVMTTVDQYTKLLRDTYGKDIWIIRNNALTRNTKQHDGQVYESFGWEEPSSHWWESLFVDSKDIDYNYSMLTYLEWFEKKENPLIYMEVYEDEDGADSDGNGEYKNMFEEPGFKVDEKRIRFSLTSTLLGDGFYSYEMNTNGHGSLGLIWPESYDNDGEGQGYLGYPIDEYKEIKTGIYIREYQNGVVVVNVTEDKIKLKFNQKVKEAAGFNYKKADGIEAFDGCIFLLDK